MKLQELLKEGQIPNARYGYWIMDEGTFLPVDTELAHNKIAEQYFNDPRGYIRALEEGWVRVVKSVARIGNDREINIEWRLPIDRALQGITRLISSDVDYENYFIQNVVHTDKRNALAHIRQIRQDIRVN